jgi:hypothetical protein
MPNQANFPLFGRLRFSQGTSVVLGGPGTAAIHEGQFSGQAR